MPCRIRNRLSMAFFGLVIVVSAIHAVDLLENGGSCAPDYTIAMNGSVVFSIAARNKTCTCPAYLATEGPSVFTGGIGKAGVATTFNGPIGVNGCASVLGTLGAAGVVINGTGGLSVAAGPVAIGGNATIERYLKIGGGLTVDGPAGLAVLGQAAIGGTMAVSGATALAGALDVAGTLTASGASILRGNVSVGGVATVNGGLLLPPGSVIDLAAGSGTRATRAGQIVYEGSPGAGHLHIHGAANGNGTRSVRLWDTVQTDSVRLSGTYASGGLQAEYFDTADPFSHQTGVLYNYNKLVCSKVDPSVNLYQNASCPTRPLFSTYFSVRWNGFIMVPVTGVATIYLTGTNNPRVQIGNAASNPIGSLAEGNVTNVTTVSTSPFFSAGRYYPIRVEFFHRVGSPYQVLLEASFGSGPRLPVNGTLLFTASALTVQAGAVTAAGDLTVSGSAVFTNGIGVNNGLTHLNGRFLFQRSNNELPFARTVCPNVHAWTATPGFCWTFAAAINTAWAHPTWTDAQRWCSTVGSTVCNVGQILEAGQKGLCTSNGCWTDAMCANGKGGLYLGDMPVDLATGIDQVPWGCYDNNFTLSEDLIVLCCMTRLFG